MIRIYSEKKIDTIDAFKSLKFVKGRFEITQLYLLKSLNNFVSLNYIGGDLVVLNNSSLKSLKGLDNVGDTIGNIFINGNYLIDGISSLNRLKHIKNRLVLYLLESRIINGFKNLRSVGEAIDILAGEKMYDLDAFYVLDTIFSSSFDPEVNSTSLGITVYPSDQLHLARKIFF